MAPSNAMENDKKRLRNQFTKDERTRLLAIMTEYGPLLDDKNISILSRKEIWEIIENKFNENGHSGRTSAQLKKYWQNYKYHSKRTKIIHKEVPKPLSPMTKHMVRMLAKVNPEEWAQYDVAVNAGAAKKSPKSSKPSPSDSSSVTSPLCGNSNLRNRERRGESSSPMSKVPKSDAFFTPKESRVKQEGPRSEVSESNVVVSTTDAPGSSVTVSVICPEVTSKARNIFWKRNPPSDNICPILQPGYVNESERVTGKRNSPDDFPNPEGSNGEANDTASSAQSVGQKNYQRRLNAGILPAGNESEASGNSMNKPGGYRQFSTKDDRLAKSVAAPRAKVWKNESPMNMKMRGSGTGLTKSSELIGNVVGLGKETPRATARLGKDYNPTETSGSVSMTKGRNEIAKVPGVAGVPSPPISSGDNRMAQDMREEKEGVDCAGLNEILEQLSGSKRDEYPGEARATIDRLKIIENGYNSEEDSTEGRKPDLLRLRLLQSVGLQSAGHRRFDVLRKFDPLISRMSSTYKSNEDNEETTDDSDPEKRMDVDEDTNRGKVRVRRVSLMTPTGDQDQTQRDIKIEAETETDGIETAEHAINENSEDNRVMNSMNYLVEAKLQSAKSELDHQVKLQKLEMEEKELRVRIAEMTIQETRLRIQSLIEERRRATEIHELRLAQMAAEKARSETEHAARLDATCTATAEGRARINSIERDRERSENFYQMQLRCMSGTSANGSCNLKCKHYQQ